MVVIWARDELGGQGKDQWGHRVSWGAHEGKRQSLSDFMVSKMGVEVQWCSYGQWKA